MYLLDEVCRKQDDDQQGIGQVVLVLVLLDHFEGTAGRHGLFYADVRVVSLCVGACGNKRRAAGRRNMSRFARQLLVVVVVLVWVWMFSGFLCAALWLV
jgi:hypothetical protein